MRLGLTPTTATTATTAAIAIAAATTTTTAAAIFRLIGSQLSMIPGIANLVIFIMSSLIDYINI